MLITELPQYTTGNKTVDWLIARVKMYDYTDADTIYFVGEFKGTLPYRMQDDLRTFFNNTDHSKALINTETESLTCSAIIPAMKGNNKVTFYISYCAEHTKEV